MHVEYKVFISYIIDKKKTWIIICIIEKTTQGI